MPIDPVRRPIWGALSARGCVAFTLLAACGPGKRSDTGEGGAGGRPRVTLEAPTEGERVSGIVAWAASASDDGRIASVTFLVGGEEVGRATSAPYGGTWDSSTVLNGTWKATVEALDDSGDDDRDSVQFIVANDSGLDPDAISITSPSGDTPLCGTVPVLASTSDEVAQVAFQVDGTEQSRDDAAPYQWSWDTTAELDGQHELVVIGVDVAGRQARASLVVEVDNATDGCDNPPSVAFTRPVAGDWLAGAVDLEVDAADDLGVLSVAFYVDGGILETDASVPFASALDTSAFRDGEHALKAVATDTAGQTASAEITVTVDNTGPEASLVEPLDGAEVQGEVTVRAEASDVGGVATVTLLLDGGALAVLDAEPYEVVLDSADLDFGAHTLSLLALDHAGNEATDEIGITVDNPPSVSITSPDTGEVGGELTITAEAEDDEGLGALSLAVDGVTVASGAGPSLSATLDTCADARGDTHEIRATAVDLGGHEREAVLEVTVDLPLEVELSVGAGALDETASLGVLISDDEAPSSITFAVDGVTVARSASAAGADPGCGPCGCDLYTTTWSTAEAAEGAHTLTVTVTNASGDVATDSATIRIDYDHDGDGYDAEFYGGDDCDDDDGDHSPATPELCDGLDQDCDGLVDEDYDVDGDGHLSTARCAGLSAADDCDDTDDAVYAGATEVCEDGVDNDCDGRDRSCPYEGSFTLSSVGARWTGTGSSVYAGRGLAGPGDVDGDGLDDVLVGVPYANGGATDSGNAYLLLGPASSGGALSETTAIELEGDQRDGYAGNKVAGAGDVDGDGYADLLIGAPGLDDGGDGAGGVHLVLGPTGSLSLRSADARITGASASDAVGSGMAGAGDLNGDGGADLIIGGTGVDAGSDSTGAVYLLWGPVLGDVDLSDADLRIAGATSDRIGVAVCDGADVDGDGLDDLVIGDKRAGSGAGAAYLFLGPLGTSGVVSDADIILSGGSSYTAGSAVGVGDTDADGYGDLIVGAEDFYTTGGTLGATFVVNGPVLASGGLSAADARLTGATSGGDFGADLDVGDVDSDGPEDLLIGESQNLAVSGYGYAYLWYGPVAGTYAASSADATFSGDASNSWAGEAVAFAGDVDGDGLGDVLVGAPAGTGSSSRAGAAFVLPFSAMR